ncbi:endonuclease/exonuclease/phosphatase family protein [Vibrio sp. 99-70-13A1]|uniref:endonuclease/exonuclease/phosphatase family protein n=1 Tax=Vibrio sp. 99-70-13A1 TaxID=2607601 RepID=UPI0014935DDE|nr:endonuclease/exonuclease/phosphatase family protein [Vibrio sp. 99-70-13A1]NOH98477.1 endonuclease/exonuclease/phosphatase family protein [Vibrio sp. 99-70-13A1]
MFKKLTCISALIILASFISFKAVFTIPYQAQLNTSIHSNSNSNRASDAVSNEIGKTEHSCFAHSSPQRLDVSNGLSILVWNIYKQNKENWQEALEELSEGRQLILLQEASMSEELKNYISSREWGVSQVNAFEVFNTQAGVLNLSSVLPIKACAYTHEEPWLQLPKSALWSLYQLSDGQELAVVNIHSVNFTFGTEDYFEQLDVLTSQLLVHQGPIIFAGDFNSWSEARFTVLRAALKKVGLQEVTFEPDNRTQFITGLPLDHVFYSGLEVQKTKAPVSDASDHNPLQVTFSVSTNQTEGAK